MTIVLRNTDESNTQKVAAAMTALGPPSTKPVITSENRNHVRQWLLNLGFASAAYQSATLSQMQVAYHSCHEYGYCLGLLRFLLILQPTLSDEELSENFSLIRVRITDALHNAGFELLPNTVFTPTAETVAEYRAAMPAVPATPPARQATPEAAQALEALVRAIGQNQQAPVLPEDKIIELIKTHAPKPDAPLPTEIRIVAPDLSRVVQSGLHHKALPEIVQMLSVGVNIMMVGPAGSGKTTLAEQAAKALDIPFYYNGALSSEYKLSGFVDAQGRIVSTAFRRAYETGGLYLFDEIDASMPDALLAFNAALSNNHADFPDGSIPAHKDFRCMAAANTFGRGADRVYVGRNQLDGASLDRFCVINIDYDEKLERALSANDNWTDYVQKVRAAVWELKIRHVVSPRASINGARLLAAGMDAEFVCQASVWKGLDVDSVTKIKAKAGV